MTHRRFWLIAFAPVLALTLAAGGCGRKTSAPTADTGKGDGDPAQVAKPTEAKVTGYAAKLKGKVTFNGSEADMKIVEKPPTKNQTECPKMLKNEGWYVNNKETKGIQYAVVFLRSKGRPMPKAAPDLDKPEKPELEIHQPKCQFEPRVLVLHPKQDLRILNDSDPQIDHETNITGSRNKFQKTLPKGASPLVIKANELRASNLDPNIVSCNIHPGFMSAYLWKFDHPYAAVTDAEGNYELKHVPVLDGQQLTLAVWHEMLSGTKIKEVGPVDIKDKEEKTVDIKIPN